MIDEIFQSIAVMHSQWDDVDWSGWSVVNMTRVNNIDIKQG